MAKVVTAPAIRRAGKESPKNYFRFYPGRKPRVMPNGKTDDRIMFESATYARMLYDSSYIAGAVIGPTLEKAFENGQELLLGGAGLVQAKAVDRGGEIVAPKVRKFAVPKTQSIKSFLDLVTLKVDADGNLSVVALDEDNVVYWECCTGDPQQTEETYIAALSGMWFHGSAEYMGIGQAPVVNAPSKRRAKRKADDTSAPASGQVKFAEATVPELWGEAVGAMVNGVPLWWTRVWKCRYSRDESEVVIVRQQKKYYQLYAHGGRGMYRDCSAVPGIEQVYLDNIAKLSSLGVSTTPLLVPQSGLVQTAEVADAAAEAAAE